MLIYLYIYTKLNAVTYKMENSKPKNYIDIFRSIYIYLYIDIFKNN